MCDLRHIHDPVLSFLKMEGIRVFFYLAPKTEYLMSIKVNDHRR
jgi:hypothetical protein